MDSEDSGKMGFQCNRVGDSSESLFKNHSGVDPFNGSGWDQLVSMNQSSNFGDGGSSVVHESEHFNSHYRVMLEHQAMNVSSDMVPKIPSFGSGSFSEMITSSFGLPESALMPPTVHNQRPENTQGSGRIVVHEPADSSPNVKRKRKVSESHSPFNPSKSNEGGVQKVSSRETSDCSKEQDGKEKTEQQSKRSAKQVNTSNSGEQPKDNYIHTRAKRGQATNSHSLAERVRRERISERMRLLQELVPGCDKITGKAMMLDEIINYVQSLQNQVEFLSMKLATVNPEVNIDMERLLSSKDILHARSAGSAALAIPPGLSSSHLSPGILQANFIGGAPNIPQPYHSMPQMAWDGEFQSLLQMGFDSNTSINNLGPNGSKLPNLCSSSFSRRDMKKGKRKYSFVNFGGSLFGYMIKQG
ncbi:hypothetical protein Leryth_015194 [Lithospermum erythrorhizon]|nr:hypothetical protein Leryth_015194 [Lithospermum erythrorhizon]